MRSCRNFAKDENGGIAVAFGLSVVVLGLCVGLAVDGARVYSASQKVGAALDAAALSGARILSASESHTGPAQDAALAAFRANSANMSVGRVDFADFAAVPDTANGTFTVSVRMDVPSSFARLAGIGEFKAVKSATTSYAIAKLEVALALDVTGSMNDTPPGDSQSKLAALKIAATGLVDSLFREAANDSNIRISLVPWSSGVLAGPFKTDVTGSSTGSGCIGERAGEGATSDSLPSAVTYALPIPASSLALGYACPNVEVVPLQGRLQSESLKARINSFIGNGGTAGHLGAAWAWYMLSSNWASLHPAASRPEPPARNVVKAAILMTDGVFNTTHLGGTLNAGTSGYNEQSYAMFKTLCDGMREQGIRVYTVAFDLADAYARAKLEECAGSNALTAATSAQLSSVFAAIAQDLVSVRIAR